MLLTGNNLHLIWAIQLQLAGTTTFSAGLFRVRHNLIGSTTTIWLGIGWLHHSSILLHQLPTTTTTTLGFGIFGKSIWLDNNKLGQVRVKTKQLGWLDSWTGHQAPAGWRCRAAGSAVVSRQLPGQPPASCCRLTFFILLLLLLKLLSPPGCWLQLRSSWLFNFIALFSWQQLGQQQQQFCLTAAAGNFAGWLAQLPALYWRCFIAPISFLSAPGLRWSIVNKSGINQAGWQQQQQLAAGQLLSFRPFQLPLTTTGSNSSTSSGPPNLAAASSSDWGHAAGQPGPPTAAAATGNS